MPKSELISALAWLTIPALLGPVLGPPLGGFITTYRLLALDLLDQPADRRARRLLATRYIANIREEGLPPLDVQGFILSGIGLAGSPSASPRSARDSCRRLVALAACAGVIGCWLYVRHARTAPAPLLDLNLLKVATFFASVVGGSLFRIGVGATPFLLPLFLQLGFGLTPFQSGMLTFAQRRRRHRHEGDGRAHHPPVRLQARADRERRAKQRASSPPSRLFTVATPHVVILAVLLVGGFFRSLEFTSINSIAYADIDAKAMSRATSFACVAQQLSLSAGVAVGALVLEFERMGRADTTVVAGDFPLAFMLVAVIAGKLGVRLRDAAKRGGRQPVGTVASSRRRAGASRGPASLAERATLLSHLLRGTMSLAVVTVLGHQRGKNSLA